MLPVGPRPLLAHTIDWLKLHGITQIAINVHHAARVITDYFDECLQLGVEITYSVEPRLLGTAGAAKKLEDFLDERFVVVYGDVFTNIDLTELQRFHVEHLEESGSNAAMTLSLYRVPDPTACGIVDVSDQGRIVRFIEKPDASEVFSDLANSGVLICDSALLDLIPTGREYDFGRDLLPELFDLNIPVFGKVHGYGEYVIDIGTPAGYDRAQRLAFALISAGHHLLSAPLSVAGEHPELESSGSGAARGYRP